MKKRIYAILGLLIPAMAVAENTPVKYADAANLTIVNKAQPGGSAFQRIEVARYPELTPTVTRYYRYSTGLAVAFRTDSRNIRARWTTVNKLPGANTTLIAQRGLDLYIRRDGKWVFAGVGVPNKSGTQHEAPIVEHMDTTMKECLLYLPLYDEIAGGYTDKMSFGFVVDQDEELRTKLEDGRVDYLRTITGISKLYDVSAVSIPANDGTSIGVSTRSRIDGAIEEVRAERLAAEQMELERRRAEVRAKALGGKAND